MTEREFLLMLVQKELEEERHSCDDKEWLRSLIQAKRWLLYRKRPNAFDKIIYDTTIADDIEKYLK